MIPTTASVVTLAKRWVAGDRAAGSDLVRVHDDWIRAYARQKSLSWEDWDDTAQVMRLAFLDRSAKMEDGPDSHTRAALRLAMLRDLYNERRRRGHAPLSSVDDPDLVDVDAVAESAADVASLIDRANMTHRQLAAVVGNSLGLGLSDLGRELGCHPQVVSRDIDSGMRRLRVSACPVAASPERSVVDRVRAAVHAIGPATPSEIGDALGVQFGAVRDALAILTKLGLLVADDGNKYRLAGCGGRVVGVAA